VFSQKNFFFFIPIATTEIPSCASSYEGKGDFYAASKGRLEMRKQNNCVMKPFTWTRGLL